MSKIIIGIHGLGNKVPQDTLRRWWKWAIREGLKAIDRPRLFFNFELVYWADLLYPEPLNPDLNDEKDPLFVEDPYIPRAHLVRKKPSEIRKKILNYLDKRLNKLFLNEDMTLNFTAITDMIIHRYFRDLEIYYSTACTAEKNAERAVKDVIREKLANCLRKYRKKDILLIGHSMGSIIAYDVLSLATPDLKIDTLVTIGSPLGLPIIRSKIFLEQKKDVQKGQKALTPPNISRQWYNFADLEDKVAIDYRLSDDYEENPHRVRVIDQVVYNDYNFNGHKNPHKDYGYLRTPELGQVIYDFLHHGGAGWKVRLSDKINRWLVQKLESI